MQCLTQPKIIEIEDLLDQNTVFFLTETHKRDNSIRFNNNSNFLHKTRNIIDKKGGGLMIVWNKDSKFEFVELPNDNKDILITKNKINNYIFYSIIVYFSASEHKINIELKKEIDKISKELGKIDNIDIMILGDFNGHVGFLGKQDKNNNVELILKIIN